MSELPLDDIDRLNFRELLARIDRQREEALKFAAEQRKLAAEQDKLTAEAAKFRRERSLAPVLAAAALGGFLTALGGVVAGLAPLFLRAWGFR